MADKKKQGHMAVNFYGDDYHYKADIEKLARAEELKAGPWVRKHIKPIVDEKMGRVK